MDTARAAKRTEGVEHVYLVYRRTKRYMPAAEDELLEVLEEGVEFKELLSPSDVPSIFVLGYTFPLYLTSGFMVCPFR